MAVKTHLYTLDTNNGMLTLLLLSEYWFVRMYWDSQGAPEPLSPYIQCCLEGLGPNLGLGRIILGLSSAENGSPDPPKTCSSKKVTDMTVMVLITP